MAKIDFKGNLTKFSFELVKSQITQYFNKHQIDLDDYACYLNDQEMGEQNDLQIDSNYDFGQGRSSLIEFSNILGLSTLKLEEDNQFEVLDDDGDSLYLSNMDIPTLLDNNVQLIIDNEYSSVIRNNCDRDHEMLVGNRYCSAEIDCDFELTEEFDASKLTFYCFLQYGDFFVHTISYEGKTIPFDNIITEDGYDSYQFMNADNV